MRRNSTIWVLTMKEVFELVLIPRSSVAKMILHGIIGKIDIKIFLRFSCSSFIWRRLVALMKSGGIAPVKVA